MSNTKQIPYVIKTNGSISLFLNEEGVTVNQDHPNYKKIVDSLKSGNHQGIEALVNLTTAVSQFVATSTGKTQVIIKNGQIFYGDYPVHNTLTTRIIAMMRDGFKFDHMVRFLENLLANPSARAVNETYRFLENYGLPITDDGHFLAYKAVKNNYMDIYSGKISNKVGESPSMPRYQVDEVYERDCSTGLHCGALDYVVQYGHFTKGEKPSADGNRLLIVKVNPANVVSVPQYEKHPKIRVCTYTVISEIKDTVKELAKVVYSGTTATEVKPDHVEVKKEVVNSNDDYEAGFLDGDDDRENADGYGESRQYNAGNYLKGYNDAFNGRNYLNPSEPLPAAGNYSAGYAAGESDRTNDKKYGKSRLHDSGDYLKGYNDGINGRSYNYNLAGESDIDGDELCDCCCEKCDKASYNEADLDQADEEFAAGYSAGKDDYEQGFEYESSLDVDDSDAFKDGYHEGWDVAATE